MKMKIVLGIALMMGTTTFGQTLQDAIRKTQNELFADAETDFRKLIKNEPANGANYFYFGEYFNALKEMDSADVYWQKAFDKDQANPLSLVSLGKAQWYKGNTTSGKENFAKAMQMTKSKNADVLREIANTYINAPKQNLDEAMVLLEGAMKIDAKNEENHLLMGDALLGKTPENANQAIKSYNKVLEINPKSVTGIIRVGKLYQRVGNDSLANVYYMNAISIDPTFAPAYRENAEMFLNRNRPKQAIENWKKYLELNNSTEARYRFATAMFSGKQYCEVIPEINGLHSNGFSNLYTERMLTISYAECSDDKEAAVKGLEASARFFKIAPAEKVTYLDHKYKSLLLINAGMDSLAIIEMEKFMASDENAKKELSGQLGKLYLKQKNYDKTIEHYEYKRTSSKLTPTEYFELGRAYYFGPKNYQMADTSFASLTDVSPSWAPGYFWRARTSLQLDANNEKWMAKPYYEKTFEMVKPEERMQGNNKAMALESAQYMGNYYYNSTEKDIEKAKMYYQTVLEIDPNDGIAKAFFAKVK